MVRMSEVPTPTVWPVLHYDDPAMARRFLVGTFGFREAIAVTDDNGLVIHCELRWPEGGAVVFGSTRNADGVHAAMRSGTSAVYVVTDAVDAIHDRALRAGAQVVQAPHPTAFGSGIATRAFTAADPEGNLWTFGSYRGVP